MIDKQQWSVKELVTLASAIAFILLLNDAVPFLAMPSFGQTVWSMGFAQSFANGPWYSIYSHDFGIPRPAAIAYGLSGVWPASLLIRIGLHPSDAYSSVFALYLILALFSAYSICRRLGISRLCSILGGVTWMSMPILWAHNGYAMLALGIGLLPFYFLSPLRTFGCFTGKVNVSAVTIATYLMATIISIFMDGYSFFMFAIGSSIFFIHALITFPNLRKSLLKLALPVHLISFLFAYLLFTMYIGKATFDAYELDFFRAWGLDLSFVAIPSLGEFWLFDLLGIGLKRSDAIYFGDNSVWETTFFLPLMLAGLIAWWLTRKNVKLATGALIVVIFGFYMALGPSIKINSTKPESLSISLLGQQSETMPAKLAIMPTGNAFLSKYVPGFNVMRASYRWSALGIFALWILTMIQMAHASRKNRLIWMVILICIVALNLPHFIIKWQMARDSRSMFYQIDNDLVTKLSRYIGKNEVVVFLPVGNDFIVNYLSSKAGFKTYNIGGDKNLADAKQAWPEFLNDSNVDLSKKNEDKILNFLISGNADALVVPYFDMRGATYSWPCESESLVGKRNNGVGWDKNIISISENSQNIELPITSTISNEKIFVSIPNAVSPYELHGLPDNRMLGIALQNITLKRDQIAKGIKNNHKEDIYSIKIGSGLKNRASLLAEGWHNTEENFIWSDKKATLAIPVPNECIGLDCRIVLTYSVFGAQPNRPVKVNFSNLSEMCPVHFKDKLSYFLEIFKNSPYLTVQDSGLFAVIRLRQEFAGAVNREALRTAIVNNVSYPLVLGGDSTWATYLLQSGWNNLEADKVWSKDKSTLLLPIPKDCQKGTCFAKLKFNVFGSSTTRPVHVKFETRQFNGIWHKELTSVEGDNHIFSVPLSNINGYQKIEISIPEATSPHALGISEDVRVLGIGLQHIELIRK